MSEHTFSLEHISEKQLIIIQEALDLYSRLLCGQVEELEYFFRIHGEPGTIKNINTVIRVLKEIVFPELSSNSSYGICGEKTPSESKIAYDLICVMRNGLAWHNKPQGGITVDFDTPLHVEKKEPLITFKVEETKEE